MKNIILAEPIGKTQTIRLWDVFFIGPFCLYLATRENLKSFERIIIGAIGAATIAYNAKNYLHYQKTLTK